MTEHAPYLLVTTRRLCWEVARGRWKEHAQYVRTRAASGVESSRERVEGVGYYVLRVYLRFVMTQLCDGTSTGGTITVCRVQLRLLPLLPAAACWAGGEL